MLKNQDEPPQTPRPESPAVESLRLRIEDIVNEASIASGRTLGSIAVEARLPHDSPVFAERWDELPPREHCIELVRMCTAITAGSRDGLLSSDVQSNLGRIQAYWDQADRELRVRRDQEPAGAGAPGAGAPPYWEPPGTPGPGLPGGPGAPPPWWPAPPNAGVPRPREQSHWETLAPSGPGVPPPGGQLNPPGRPPPETDRQWWRRRWILVGVPIVVIAVVASLLVWQFSPTASAGPCEPLTGDRSGAGDGVLKIGAIIPQTGSDLVSTSRQLYASIDLAITDVNTAGGVPGVQLAPLGPGTVADEGVIGTDAACAAAATLLANGVDAIIGPSASSDALRVYPRVTTAQVLMVSPATTSPELTSIQDGGLYFRTIPPDTLQGQILANLVADEGNRNVAIISREDSYGRGLAAAVDEKLRALSVSTVRLPYTPNGNDTDFTSILDTLSEQSIDGIVLIGFAEMAKLVRLMLDKGITPKTHKIYGTDGFLQNTFPSQVVPGHPEKLAGLRGTVPYADPAYNERLKQFSPGLQDLTFGAQAYDAVVIVALAAAVTRSDDARLLAQQLASVTRGGQKCASYTACLALLTQSPSADIDYDGVSGPLDFATAGEPCRANFVLSAFDTTSHLLGVRVGSGSDGC